MMLPGHAGKAINHRSGVGDVSCFSGVGDAGDAGDGGHGGSKEGDQGPRW
jgi:hypothetical protein